MTVRCKMSCNFKSQSGEGDSAVSYIQLSPVYSGSEENKRFFQSTPGGALQFYTVNKSAADQFEQGKEYYIDITPAEAN